MKMMIQIHAETKAVAGLIGFLLTWKILKSEDGFLKTIEEQIWYHLKQQAELVMNH